MAVLSLCDLCGGKVKMDFIKVDITGKVRLYDGEPPAPPPGFKYRDTEDGKSKIVKRWDEFGNYLGQTEYVERPKKIKNVRVVYDLCEGCGQKLTNLLEHLRQKKHLEAKEVELLGDTTSPTLLDFLDDDEGGG